MTLGESINNAFERVYILNLKNSIERRQIVKERCDNINLKYEFFNAYDGVKLFKNFDMDNGSILSNRHHPYPSNVRYIAAQIASEVMIMNAINDDLQNFVLLNDDIYWDNYQNFTDIDFLNIKNKLPKNWDIIILGSLSTLYPYNGSVDYLNSQHFSGCHGIAINNTIYHDYLKFSYKREYVGDGFVDWLSKQNKHIYSIIPDICLQDHSIPTTALMV